MARTPARRRWVSSARALVGLVALAALAGWSGVGIVFAQQRETTRVVEGRLINGTAGADTVSGVPVVLHQESATRHEDLQATTDLQGLFRFEEIVFDPDAFYGVSVIYQGALYGSDLDLSEGSPPQVSLTVYEVGDSQASLSVSHASVLFAQVDGSSQTLWALEIMRVRNSTDRTYVPGPEPMRLLRFSLPPQARELQVDTDLMGADVLQVDRGFALTASVPPGEHEVMFAYQFPYSGSEDVFVKSFPYGADSVRVLAPFEVVRLSGQLMVGPEVVTVGDRPYQLLRALDLPRDSRISLVLSGLPQATLSDRVDRRLEDVPWEYAAPLALGLMMVSLVGLTLWRRSSRSARASVLAGVNTLDAERDRIIRMIAELEEGTLSEDRHRRRRAALMAQLAALSRGRPAQSDQPPKAT